MIEITAYAIRAVFKDYAIDDKGLSDVMLADFTVSLLEAISDVFREAVQEAYELTTDSEPTPAPPWEAREAVREAYEPTMDPVTTPEPSWEAFTMELALSTSQERDLAAFAAGLGIDVTHASRGILDDLYRDWSHGATDTPA